MGTRMTWGVVGLLLLLPAQAAAGPGSGSASYGGGGGGGYSGGGSGASGGDGESDPWVVALVFGAFLAAFLVVAVLTWRERRTRKARVARVVAASAEAADDDAWFAADTVQSAAAALYRETVEAWDARDRDRLAQLVGEDLMIEWRRRLDDFDAKGWHNRTSILDGPHVEYVGIVNREDDAEDRVCVRLTGRTRDVVEARDGTVVKQGGNSSEEVALCEYWTLLRRGDRWIVASIEQGTEGAHNLAAEVVATPADDERLRDRIIVERAEADAVPVAELPIAFAGDAHRTALDLSLLDERFAPHVLEAAARRALAAWAEAVDGDDEALEAVAEPGAVRDLLHDDDATARTRLVVRGPQVEEVRIVGLDGDARPPCFAIEARVHGRRYVEDRDTTALRAGSRDRATTFTERWRLVLGDEPGTPWRLAARVATPA